MALKFESLAVMTFVVRLLKFQPKRSTHIGAMALTVKQHVSILRSENLNLMSDFTSEATTASKCQKDPGPTPYKHYAQVGNWGH